jgi:hypothetical protein
MIVVHCSYSLVFSFSFRFFVFFVFQVCNSVLDVAFGSGKSEKKVIFFAFVSFFITLE